MDNPSQSEAYRGAQNPWSNNNDPNAIDFIVRQIMAGMATAEMVIVRAVSNSGGVAAAGTVDVQIMVNQVDGYGNAIPHGTIFSVPYQRVQGGANAVIMDPQTGDIGVCVFTAHDSSSVKATKAIANPGSARRFDYADGLYLGGFLNGIPTQYVRFFSGGIEVVSPTKITLTAPNVEVDGAFKVTGTAHITDDVTADKNVAVTEKITAAEGDIGGSGTQPVMLSDSSPALKLKAK